MSLAAELWQVTCNILTELKRKCGLRERVCVVQVSVMVLAAGLSCVLAVFIAAYSSLTLTYGEEDTEVFHHHSSVQVVTTHTNSVMHLILVKAWLNDSSGGHMRTRKLLVLDGSE